MIVKLREFLGAVLVYPEHLVTAEMTWEAYQPLSGLRHLTPRVI